MNYISLYDLILIPIFAAIVYFFAYKKYVRQIDRQPYYQYYIKGLTLKIAGGFGVCFIYMFYYTTGGDTLNYFDSNNVMIKLLEKDYQVFFDILLNGDNSFTQYSSFDFNTGWPYYWGDHNTFFLVRLTCLLNLIAFKSYLCTTLLLAWISYSGSWRIYEVFCEEFPSLYKEFAIAFLFIPSVAFWGSGLLKDTVTYAAVGWFVYGIYNGAIKKRHLLRNCIIIFISCYVIMAIKPYILYALLTGTSVWLVSSSLSSIKNSFVKILVGPLVLVIGIGGVYLLLMKIGQNFGKFSVDTVLERAVIIQADLVKNYYGGNTFDIGSFDASISSMLSKAPLAIVAGVLRPFIWEARNPVMLLSGLENTYILYLTLLLVIKLRLNIFILLKKSPILLQSMVYALFLAFVIGLTTPNFGSLVRYRIPLIPFYLASLFILNHFRKEKLKLKG